jgi:hypothetical protein
MARRTAVEFFRILLSSIRGRKGDGYDGSPLDCAQWIARRRPDADDRARPPFSICAGDRNGFGSMSEAKIW